MSKKIFIEHFIAQCWGIDANLLNNKTQLLQKATKVAYDLNLTIVKSFTHKFKPHGLSLILVISESHFAIHTWPELKYMHIDALSCSPNSGLKSLKKVLQREFSPQQVKTKKIEY